MVDSRGRFRTPWGAPFLFWTVIHTAVCPECLAADAPNIVFIIADDLGWNDVGFHGSNQIPTPNLDALAYNGIILNSHYAQSTSSPSRAALFTGKYAIKLGMQGSSFLPGEKRSLPEGKLMPEYFKDLGYSTYLVGKWHLGYSRWNETPTFRGFDHHYGFYNGHTSYYDYLGTKTYDGIDYNGFDLRRDGVPSFEDAGHYATDTFTEYSVKVIQEHDLSKPLFLMLAHLAVHAGNTGKLLEAPQEEIDKLRHIEDANRRTYAAMVTKLDESVGTLVEALESKKMLQNTVIAFISDNGAPTVAPHFKNWGSNYPLRGLKNTLFEGGIRSVAFIYSPLLIQSARVTKDLMHITDWLPTLYSAANGDIANLDPEIDGIDQWPSLVYDLPSPRNDILLNINEKTRNAALRFYNWKLIVGTSMNGTYNDYYGEAVMDVISEVPYNTSAVFNSKAGKVIRQVSYTPLTETEYEQLRAEATVTRLDPKAKKNPCDPASGDVCLYDIPKDPCEENDLAKYFPSVVRRMKRALVEYRKSLVPQLEEAVDIENSSPKLFGFTWNPWLECSNVACTIPV
nr:unnamed protein product [Callosobruchus chinensis]